MGSIRLTKGIKESIARSVAKELLAPPLRELWKDVEVKFDDLVRDIFKDFDWEHVGPYREFINWHREIRVSRLPQEWRIDGDTFFGICNLHSMYRVSLSIEYPSKSEFLDVLGDAVSDYAQDILRPYVERYFEARKCYEDIKLMLLNVSTYEQLKNSLPELAKYASAVEVGVLPEEQVSSIRNFLKGGENTNG